MDTPNKNYFLLLLTFILLSFIVVWVISTDPVVKAVSDKYFSEENIEYTDLIQEQKYWKELNDSSILNNSEFVELEKSLAIQDQQMVERFKEIEKQFPEFNEKEFKQQYQSVFDQLNGRANSQ